MLQDYRSLTEAELEGVEKQTLRTIVQALQQYSREAKEIFDRTEADSTQEVIVLAEDLVQYALEVAECYPIDRRFAGFIDYKRVRWLSTPRGIFPQALLVDAKASTENNRETLQASQLSMDADFDSGGKSFHMPAGVPQHMDIPVFGGGTLPAVTTSAFVHFHYDLNELEPGQHRRLKDIYALALPHQLLKATYNPDATKTFYGQGKHSPARQEQPRIRVYFTRLSAMCNWRLQRLRFAGGDYTEAIWNDIDDAGQPIATPFDFIGRGMQGL